jgi:hypothetical protein
MRTDVQKVYSMLATWYVPFRSLWVLLTSRQAERDSSAPGMALAVGVTPPSWQA